MNILVTGCNGQLGNEMQLLEKHHPEHNYFNTDVNELDITDEQAIQAFVEANAIDGIVNCAAYTAVDRAETDQQLATKLNAEAPAYLAQAIEQRKGWFIQISTDYVFDGHSLQPYTEDQETNPQTVYGKTKLVGEFNALKLCSHTVIIRTAWLYSPYGRVTTAEYPTPAKRPAYSVLCKTKIQQTYHLNIPQWQDSLHTVVKQIQQEQQA